jgi:hypothetical protein
MGNNICGIVVNSLPKIENIESLDKKRLKTKFIKTKINGLSPKDLSISFKENCTLIFLDLIFYQNISEQAELTNLENDLNNIFPNSKILIIAINDTVNFAGYSLIENGTKLRTKATVNDTIFLDYGELNKKEMEFYKEIVDMMKPYPDTIKRFDEKTTGQSSLEKQKSYLDYRDFVYSKAKKDNKYNYKDGSLDNFIIENEFHNILGCDYYDLESFDFIVFERRKLNFTKDSLKEFLYTARNELK